MKKFYAVMIALLAMVIGTAGCGEDDPVPEYGVPVNDSDVEIPDDAAQPDYGVPVADLDPDLNDTDTDIPDEDYHTDYGVIATKYNK